MATGPVRDPVAYADNVLEFLASFNQLLERAWVLGLSREDVAKVLERRLREKHFQARVMP